MAKIQVLDKHVAELIAAGEVVERPASVVKELMENTIDAGARHVTVEIKDGGVSYIRVTDDGCGITREDVPTAFLRHATSKVRDEADLVGISTLGFRGEALASVAAVAKVELTTCAAGEIVGTHYVIHGGEEILMEDAGCPEGTTFIVENLFYNIPARMKFLKKDVSEGNAVAGVVERLALSHPEVSVKFIRNGRTEMQTPGDGQLLSCVHAVFGKPFASGLIPVEYAMGGIKVSGYICKPEAGRQNRTMQHFFVNGRYVKTQTAMVAMERAYKGVMMVGRFPTCVLFLEMPPETVDANVHPAKIEVRFINEKPVFDAVYYGVRSAIEQGDSVRRVLLKEEQASAPRSVVMSSVAPAVSTPSPQRTTPSSVAEIAIPVKSKPMPKRGLSYLDMVVDDDRPVETRVADATDKAVAWEKRTSPVAEEPPITEEKMTVPSPTEACVAEQTDVVAEQMVMPVKAEPQVKLIGEFLRTYILAEMDGCLFIIDKHAAHERILYNELKKNARSDAQMLLAPVSVSVSCEEHSALLENLAVLSEAGIEAEDFGGHTVLIRSFPLILAGTDVEAIVREIATGLTAGSHQVTAAKLDWIYHSSACRAATKAGDSSQPAELLSLACRVLTEPDIRYCPHGRPVCIEMTREMLEKQFGRLG